MQGMHMQNNFFGPSMFNNNSMLGLTQGNERNQGQIARQQPIHPFGGMFNMFGNMNGMMENMHRQMVSVDMF